MADDSPKLLLDWSRHRKDDAVRALVERHSPVVYGTALRYLNGDRAAAQDVTQEVFLLLLRKAAGLQGVFLSGWLYRQACRRAANYARAEQRRKSRERTAAGAMEVSAAGTDQSPFLSRELDEAILLLLAADRDAIVLRFFEGKDFRGVGAALGITEEAARKRVGRALERLGANLKKQGIVNSGCSLEVMMLGAEFPPVPEPFATMLSARVVEAGAVARGGGAMMILKPLLAGSIAASLVAGTTRIITEKLLPDGDTGREFVASRSGERMPGRIAELPETSSLDGIIAEIQRARSGPDNTLTKLRIDVILGRIPNEGIPEFIALADTKLSVADQVAIYGSLMKRWAEADPQAALGFIVAGGIDPRVDTTSGTNLLNNVFTDWSRKDREASAVWLVEHWDEPALGKTAFLTSLRSFLAMGIADQLFRNKGVGPLFEFVGTLPAPARMEVLGVAAGDSPYHSGLDVVPVERLLEFHRALQGLPEKEAVAALATRFWTNVASRHPGFEDLLPLLTPAEKFQVAMGEMNVGSRRKKETTRMAGGGLMVSFDPVKDHAEREAAAIRAGEAAGLPRAEIVAAMGRALLEGKNEQRIDRWYDDHGGGPDSDAHYVAMTRQALAAKGWSGDQLPEMVAIRWASRISDPELRLSFARGAFLRLMMRDAGAAVAFPDQADLPAGIAAELKSLLAESP